MKDMATCTDLHEEEPFCSICLAAFIDPVVTTCGHSFCMKCISQYWDTTDKYVCPLCKKTFSSRPELQAKLLESSSSSLEQQAAKAADVLCGACSESQALKSCTVCLTSYCGTHLECHLRIPGLRRHELVDPVENLEDRLRERFEKANKTFSTFNNRRSASISLFGLCFTRKVPLR